MSIDRTGVALVVGLFLILLVLPITVSVLEGKNSSEEPEEIREVVQTTSQQDNIKEKNGGIPDNLIVNVEVSACDPRYNESVEEIVSNTYYDVPLSTDLQEHIYKTLEEEGMPDDYVKTVLAIIYVESRYKVEVENEYGCVGLMQVSRIHTDTFEELGFTADDLTDPYLNIRAGIRLLKEAYDWALETYPHSRHIYNYMLMAYNNGHGGAREIIESGKYSTSYVTSVKHAEEELQILM